MAVPATPLLAWLAIYALLNSLMQGIMGYVFVIVGRQWLATALRRARVAVLAPSVVVAGTFSGVAAVPVAATASAAVFLPVVMHLVTRVLPVRVSELVSCLWRPVVAATLMAVVVRWLSPLADHLLPRLVCEVSLGAATYVAGVFVTWWLSGRPARVEEKTWRALVGRLRSG